MDPPRKRKKRAPGRDRIGALPDALLQRILSFLPAQQAVQICVLARRWCDLWKSTTGLLITGGDEFETRPVREFQNFVDHLLLLRGCAPLDTCLLRVDVCSEDDLPRVHLWIQHVLLCKVRLLELYIATDSYRAAEGFHVGNLRLVSRHLTRPDISDVVLTDRFLDFGGCPSLEDLEICNGVFDGATMMSSKSLKRLRIICCTCDVHRRTRIYVPNLVSLRVDCPWTRTPVLERMPLLREAVVSLEWGGCTGPCDDLDCKDEYCKRYFDMNYDNSHDILLNGLSEAKELALMHDSGKRSTHKMEMKGMCNAMERSTAISEHLKIVAIKCDVVDAGVFEVLKFLGTLNICFEDGFRLKLDLSS